MCMKTTTRIIKRKKIMFSGIIASHYHLIFFFIQRIGTEKFWHRIKSLTFLGTKTRKKLSVLFVSLEKPNLDIIAKMGLRVCDDTVYQKVSTKHKHTHTSTHNSFANCTKILDGRTLIQLTQLERCNNQVKQKQN